MDDITAAANWIRIAERTRVAYQQKLLNLRSQRTFAKSAYVKRWRKRMTRRIGRKAGSWRTSASVDVNRSAASNSLPRTLEPQSGNKVQFDKPRGSRRAVKLSIKLGESRVSDQSNEEGAAVRLPY